jgi:hypothetical protein
MKPPHACPDHPHFEQYRPEMDDYPDDEAQIENEWRSSKGIDADGQMWLTPRQIRNVARLENIWMQEKSIAPTQPQ